MKLMPLFDRVVLKQLVAEETTVWYRTSGPGKRKTTAGRGYRSRSWQCG